MQCARFFLPKFLPKAKKYDHTNGATKIVVGGGLTLKITITNEKPEAMETSVINLLTGLSRHKFQNSVIHYMTPA